MSLELYLFELGYSRLHFMLLLYYTISLVTETQTRQTYSTPLFSLHVKNVLVNLFC